MDQRGDLIEGDLAKFYDLATINFKGLKAVHKKAVSLINIKEKSSLLDIGCGTGTVLKALGEKFGSNISLFGIDPSLDMLEIAKIKTNGLKINFKQAYGDELPFMNNQFDWIISILAMHHIPNEQKEKVISEIRRVLKPNGIVLISDLGRPKNFIGKILAWFSRNHSFTRGNTETIEKIMIDNGFKIIEKRWSWFFIEHIIFQK